jgi:hypothetical protein
MIQDFKVTTQEVLDPDFLVTVMMIIDELSLLKLRRTFFCESTNFRHNTVVLKHGTSYSIKCMVHDVQTIYE